MTANFGDYPLLPIFIASAGIIVIAAEIGRWLGTRAGDRGEQVRTLEGAVLGLLALMIAFTFEAKRRKAAAQRDFGAIPFTTGARSV